jgi:acyl-CoA synthetase (AMP-forming)/AMP-acid ligase II
LPERLRAWSRTKPEGIFCTFVSGGKSEQITFGRLFERSCAYARFYAEKGVKRGDLVIIILQHSPHLFYSYLGALVAGAIPSFMPFPSPKQRADLYWAEHRALFDRIDPRLIVTYERNMNAARESIPGFSIPMAVASDEILTPANSTAATDYAGFESRPDDVACLQHSSGTTGLKKGVMMTHAAIVRQTAAYSRAIGFGERDVIASWLPLYHDMGFDACFMGSVIEGTHLVALDPFEWTLRPSILFDAIERHRATFCWMPNFAFSHHVNTAPPEARWDLSSIRAFINCSEPCKPQTFARFLHRFENCGVEAKQLQVCYAMAENIFAVTQTPLEAPASVRVVDGDALSLGNVRPAPAGAPGAAMLSCGIPVDGVRVRICDLEGHSAGEGAVGEIHVTSPFLFDGYYKLPDLTRERLRDGWYGTGDMGFLLDGELFVTGRIDDMAIVNGRNYYLHDFEPIVNGIEGVLPGRNVAIRIDDERSDATVVVVLAELAAGADERRVATAVRRAISDATGLAVHAVVAVGMGQLVKTTSGKISRTKNKQLYVQGAFARPEAVR